MHRDHSNHLDDKQGFDSPDLASMIHMCRVSSGYHGNAVHVSQNHDISGAANQNRKLLFLSVNRIWSIFAEAYEAETRDFGIFVIMQWHLIYEGPELNAHDAERSQVLCPVTASNAADFPPDHLGPHRSLALVQQPQSPLGFESVIHTMVFMIQGVKTPHNS